MNIDLYVFLGTKLVNEHSKYISDFIKKKKVEISRIYRFSAITSDTTADVYFLGRQGGFGMF